MLGRLTSLLLLFALVSSGCSGDRTEADPPLEPTPPGPVPGSDIVNHYHPPTGAKAGSTVRRYPGWSTHDWEGFPTYDSAPSRREPFIPTSEDIQAVRATLQPGDPARGRSIARDIRIGNCASCHVLPGVEMPGNVGPSLLGYGANKREEAWIFEQIFDSRTHGGGFCPPFGTTGALPKDRQFSGPDHQGIADIAAYLRTLDEQGGAPTGLDDPLTRPPPNEDRDPLDPTENPAMSAIDTAMELFSEAGPKGKSCVDCHADPKTALAGAATKWPRWDQTSEAIIGLERFLEQHANEQTGHRWPTQSEANLSLAIYVRYLSNGMPLSVDLRSPAAASALARGQALLHRKIGQLDLSCIDCHEQSAGKWLRGQYISAFRGQITHFPEWRTSRGEIWDIRKRIEICILATRANPPPPTAKEYVELELALSAMSQGLPLQVPGIRH